MLSLKQIQFSNWIFSFFTYAISSICLSKYPYSYFPSYFCFLVYLIFLFVPALPLLLLPGVISFSFSLKYILWIHVLMNLRDPQYWRILYLLLFLIHIVCLYHLSGVRLYAKSSISLWISPLSILRMIQSILQRGLTRFLFLKGFLRQNLVFRSFLIPQRFSFVIFSIISIRWLLLPTF